ncbi:MAG: phosphatase PAP2 family protein [Bacteroidetes bacterium]|nr:phosphatase PAP2 family protein [Bacteroidota bacterium]
MIKRSKCRLKQWMVPLFLFMFATTFGQDTLTPRVKKSRVLAWALPSTLITYGAVGTFVPSFHDAHIALQKKVYALSNDGPHYEDYAQYLPILTVYALDFTQLPSQSTPLAQTWKLGIAFGTMGASVNAIKYTAKIERPDGSSKNAFPSGHTATAFMAAEFLRQEYGGVSPLISIGGYAVATYVGTMRMFHNRHYLTDVAAGAGIGILSVQFAYWLYPKLEKKWRAKHPKKADSSFNFTPLFSPNALGIRLTLK